MSRRTRLTIAALAATMLVAAPLSAAQSQAPVPGVAGGDAARQARADLAADADRGLTVDRDTRGDVVFAGVSAAGGIDNPGVRASTDVTAAAEAHLDRYGPAFGTTRPGTSLVQTSVTPTVSGQDAVRFAQRVDGVPVIGAEIVVSLRPDRELGSMLSTLSAQRTVAPATVTEGAAARRAVSSASRSAQVDRADLDVSRLGRWLFDPSVLGAGSSLGARGAWRFEIGDGAAVRRLVLVDDRTGSILLDTELIQQIDRVVCDQANAPVASESTCTSGFARTEGSGASGVADVNTAFDLSGAVSDYYQQIGGINLTNALGIKVGGVKKLASTVRFCYAGDTCPYANAFWNGKQMYYGAGYAGADDVVGHEMTHGIIDQYSELFYWGQSGAINESIADIMGEIVDHRHPSTGDSPTSWAMGEDLPGFPSGLRNMQNPTLFNDPDKMTSGLWVSDVPNYGDGGGVHTNSGVSNKTAYLISQGGSFNGQSVTGIDGSDAGLTKTATLYLDVIQTLSSGSDYADLGRVLDQRCQDLLAAGSLGFTAADCTNVHTATVATELGITPTNAPQPPDAADSCPGGSVKRVLLDSETGNPTSKFDAGITWGRAPDSAKATWGSNATSGQDSWFSSDPATAKTSALAAASGIALPPGQQSYLWFQHWRLLDYNSGSFYDGGTVEVDDLGTPAGPRPTAGLPWVNGPAQSQVGSARLVFGGDSFGFIASRLDLSSFQGDTVKPRFTMRTDGSVSYIGWFLDDVRVYTCDTSIRNQTPPKVTGTAKVGKKLTAKPGIWTPGATFTYQWRRGTKAISGATATTYRLTRADRGKKIKVTVTAALAGFASVSKSSKPTAKVK